MLHKMLKSGKLGKIYGCLSTGKEANVYLAEGGDIDLETMEKTVGAGLEVKLETEVGEGKDDGGKSEMEKKGEEGKNDSEEEDDEDEN